METLIYSKPSCPYCVKAKALLDKHGYSYKEITVDGIKVTKQTMNSDLGRTDLNTVPQIVLNGKFISGGYMGLLQHLGE